MALSTTRQARIQRVHGLKSQGLSSKQIGERLDLAPSTVRDYLNDPLRRKARRRQLKWGIGGVHMPEGGTEILRYKKTRWKNSQKPAGPPGPAGEAKRERQMRAMIGYYRGRG